MKEGVVINCTVILSTAMQIKCIRQRDQLRGRGETTVKQNENKGKCE